MRPEHEVLAIGGLDTMLKSYLGLFGGREVVKLIELDWRDWNPGAELATDDDGAHLVAVISPRGLLAIHRYRTAEPPTRERVIADNAALFSDRASARPQLTTERLAELIRLAPQA